MNSAWLSARIATLCPFFLWHQVTTAIAELMKFTFQSFNNIVHILHVRLALRYSRDAHPRVQCRIYGLEQWQWQWLISAHATIDKLIGPSRVQAWRYTSTAALRKSGLHNPMQQNSRFSKLRTSKFQISIASWHSFNLLIIDFCARMRMQMHHGTIKWPRNTTRVFIESSLSAIWSITSQAM